MTEFKNKEEYAKWKAEKAKKSQESLKAKESQQNGASGVTEASIVSVNSKTTSSASTAKKNIKKYVAVVLALIITIGSYFFYQSYIKLDVKKFDGVYKAAKKIQVSTSLGVSYLQFGEILNNFGTEIYILKDKPLSTKEKELFVRYLNAFDFYSLSHRFWKVKIDYSGSIDTDTFQKAKSRMQESWQNANLELEQADKLIQ